MKHMLITLFKSHRLICVLFIASVVFTVSSCSTKSTPSYQLTTSSIPAEGGSVTPAAGEFNDGEQIQLEATANQNWVFSGWEGDHTGTQNPASITMNNDKNINARFVKQEFTLTVNTTGNGSVSETVVQARATNYDAGTVVELEASSDEGWQFSEWQGDLQGSENPVTITLDNHKTVTALFEVSEYSVTAVAEGPGSVSVTPDKANYEHGETVTFAATPDSQMEFLGWFGTFEVFEMNYEHQITEDTDVTALFSSVLDAVFFETIEIVEEGGFVTTVFFEIWNYLLDEVLLTNLKVYDETENLFAETDISEPFVIGGRSIFELRLDFTGDTTDEETFKEWSITWMFDYKGNSYEKEQQVGEPEGNAKRTSAPGLISRTEARSIKIEQLRMD